MVAGLDGLPGPHAPRVVELELREERGPAPTHPRLTMVETVGERMLQLRHVTVTHVKVRKPK